MHTDTVSTRRGARAVLVAGGDATPLVCADGRHLAATWTEPPAGRAAHALAVVNPATGVPRGYYRAFAEWLAGRGYSVLTYDYRGLAGSRRGAMRHEPATMRDWAVLDTGAAFAAAEARRAGRPLLVVGHSFGGHAVGFTPGIERASAVLGIAAQVADVRHFPGRHRAVAEFFFRGLVPAATALFGHLPGWLLGGAALPLPAGVARDWARWGLTRGGPYGDLAMRAHSSVGAVVAPVHLWNVSDDLTYAPPATVDALAAVFRNAAVQRHTLAPAHIGEARLGHFGAFRRAVGPRTWPLWLAPLEAAVPALRAPA